MSPTAVLSETEVLMNQKTILENQALILRNQEEIKKNQKTLDIIVKNQEEIKKNQKSLNVIVTNQEEPGKDSRRRSPLNCVQASPGPKWPRNPLVLLTGSAQIDIGSVNVGWYKGAIEQVFHLDLHRQNSRLDPHVADRLHLLVAGVQHPIADPVRRFG